MSDAFLLILLQMSIVKIVELLLKIEVKDDIRADIITANINPTEKMKPIISHTVNLVSTGPIIGSIMVILLLVSLDT